MKRILLAALIAVTMIPVTAGPASACTCVPASPEEHADDARVVFTGRVRAIERDEFEHTVLFRVTKVYKGQVDRRVTVVTASNSAACGCSFREGGKYTVFGRRRAEPFSTNLCSGTKKGGIDPDEYGLPPGHSPS